MFSPSGNGAARPVSWLALHRTVTAFPELIVPVALRFHVLALCAYSYGVVADVHRASRHLAWLTVARLNDSASRMKLSGQILQCIDCYWAGRIDPSVHVEDATLLHGRHAVPARAALQYGECGLAAAHQHKGVRCAFDHDLQVDLWPVCSEIIGDRVGSGGLDDLRGEGVLADGDERVIPDRHEYFRLRQIFRSRSNRIHAML